jgi:SAM-dependent methyltransferase
MQAESSPPAARLDDLLAAYAAMGGELTWAEQARQEALFGFAEVAPLLRPGQRVLDIGAGRGLLAALMAGEGVLVDALEPLGPGFHTFGRLLAFVARRYPQVRPLDLAIEALDAEAIYDLAVSVNVFEHVGDWPQAVRGTLRALKPGARAVILCPNYDVPYESHFGLPVLGTKQLTHRVFAAQIRRHEERRGGQGLWDSLNFIRGTALRDFCRREGIPAHFDHSILERMGRRVTTDPEFRARRGQLAPLVAAAEKIGLFRALARAPLRLQPYLRVELERPTAGAGP